MESCLLIHKIDLHMKNQISIQRFTLLLVLSFCLIAVNAQKKQQNFLFVGNSFTMRHELPAIFASISNEANPASLVQTEIVGYGGRTLFHHWECFRSYDRIVINKLSQTDFDNTILELEKLNTSQEAPSFYTNYWQILGQNEFYSKYVKNSKHSWADDKNIIKSAIFKHKTWNNDKKNSIDKFNYLVLQSWVDMADDFQSGYFKYASLFAGMAKANNIKTILYITAPYAHNESPVTQAVAKEQAVGECRAAFKFSKQIDAIVVPIPLAITLAQESKEPIARTLTFRYKKDFHPNQTMAYLTACTFYAAVYGKSPEGILFNKVTETKSQNIHGEQVAANSSDTKMSNLVNPDGGPLEVFFTDEQRLFLQRIAWKAVTDFNNGNY